MDPKWGLEQPMKVQELCVTTTHRPALRTHVFSFCSVIIAAGTGQFQPCHMYPCNCQNCTDPFVHCTPVHCDNHIHSAASSNPKFHRSDRFVHSQFEFFRSVLRCWSFEEQPSQALCSKNRNACWSLHTENTAITDPRENDDINDTIVMTRCWPSKPWLRMILARGELKLLYEFIYLWMSFPVSGTRVPLTGTS